MPYSPMPLKLAQVGNLGNIICDLNKVTRRIHHSKTCSEQQAQQKLAVLKLLFQSQNPSRTTTSTKSCGVEVIHSNLPYCTIHNRPTQNATRPDDSISFLSAHPNVNPFFRERKPCLPNLLILNHPSLDALRSDDHLITPRRRRGCQIYRIIFLLQSHIKTLFQIQKIYGVR